MLLRLMMFVPLLRQFMLSEEFCVDLTAPTVWTAELLEKSLKAMAGRVDWRNPQKVNTSATIRLEFWRFYKLVSRPVYVLDVTHGANTHRYYLTRSGKLYQGYLDSELFLVDLDAMSTQERTDLIMALD